MNYQQHLAQHGFTLEGDLWRRANVTLRVVGAGPIFAMHAHEADWSNKGKDRDLYMAFCDEQQLEHGLSLLHLV